MSSLYEDELNRLLKEKKARVLLLKKEGATNKKVDVIKVDADVLEAELKHYQNAMERFRAKQNQPSSGQDSSR